MDSRFQIIRTTRTNFLSLISDLSTDDLNDIPEGFNNNIIWNFGHIISSQQVLCYQLSGLPFIIEEDLIARYRKGTKPEKYIEREEVQRLKDYLFSTIDQLEEDYRRGIFANFSPYKTHYGAQLNTIDDAISFFAVHDALHYGYASAQCRL
jgi:hypothetical protein